MSHTHTGTAVKINVAGGPSVVIWIGREFQFSEYMDANDAIAIRLALDFFAFAGYAEKYKVLDTVQCSAMLRHDADQMSQGSNDNLFWWWET